MKDKKYSNEEILDMANDVLINSEYKTFELAYVLRDKKDPENSYAVATNGDEIIGFNPFESKIETLPEWDFCADNDLFYDLEKNKEIIYMSLENHYGVWNEIANYYPEDINNRKGMQEYLKYCKKQKINISKIQKVAQKNDIKDVMQYLEKVKKERER